MRKQPRDGSGPAEGAEAGVTAHSASSATPEGNGMSESVRLARTAGRPDFASLPDLAARQLGGSVVDASDELFADKENLITSGPPAFTAGELGNKGKVYDGWETRRRRDPGKGGPDHDYAIVRLGAAGIVHGVVVDTTHFRGNYPPEISVDAAAADRYPSPAELAGLTWHPLVGRTAAAGDSLNYYPVSEHRRCSHVRLSIYPDGGVARFRVHGRVVADPVFLTGTIDLAAAENGATIARCSDAFYSSAAHLLLPGRARHMGEGWENARRRGGGHDWVIVRLAAAGMLRHVEIDTSCFIGNAPGWVRVLAADDSGALPGGPVPGSAIPGDVVPGGAALGTAIPDDAVPDGAEPGPGPDGGESGGDSASPWWEVLPKTRVQPDTRHRFVVTSPRTATMIRLDVIPDGGLARLRVHGYVAPEALTVVRRRWLDALP
jgi:allantoicase